MRGSDTNHTGFGQPAQPARPTFIEQLLAEVQSFDPESFPPLNDLRRGEKVAGVGDGRLKFTVEKESA